MWDDLAVVLSLVWGWRTVMFKLSDFHGRSLKVAVQACWLGSEDLYS